MSLAPWFPYTQPRPAARLRLVCLPHAGGAASSFRAWQRLLPSDWALLSAQYPGRETRFSEAPPEALEQLVDGLAGALAADSTPVAVFGHSFGATVGFELCRALEARGRPAVHLFASGAGAPQLPPPPAVGHSLSDAQFMEYVRGLGGFPPALFENEELAKLVLRPLRADFLVYERYQYPAGARLSATPISAFGGEADGLAQRPALEAWGEVGRLAGVRVFPGDHFYLASAQESLIAELVRALPA